MKKIIAVALFAVSAIAMSSSTSAAPCKDSKGKFIKCPIAAAAPVKPAMAVKPATGSTVKKAPCRDAKGKFKKC